MRYSIIFILLLFLACNSDEPRIPSEVLKESEMVEIIKDLQLMESAHKDIGLFGTKKRAMSDTSFMIILNEHEVLPSQFDSSLNFYAHYPKIMERIMEKVEWELKREQ